MEEKERYEIHIYDDICVDLYDNGVLDKSINDTYKLEELLNQQSKRIKELGQENQQLKQRLADKEKYTYTGKEVGKIEQNYDNQLAIIEKALELACEHIKEDLKCDDTQDEIYNYFKQQAKEMLGNE